MRRWLGSITAVALTTMSPALAQVPPNKWDAWVELGGRFSDHRAIGEGILFAPLLQTHDTLVFADVRGMFDDHDAREGNFGLGIRRMYASAGTWVFMATSIAAALLSITPSIKPLSALRP